MTWWSWVLIWSGLALTPLAVLVAFALSYWRKGKKLLRQLEEVSIKLDAISPREIDAVVNRAPSSLFADRDEVRRAYEATRDARRDKIALKLSARAEQGKLLCKPQPTSEVSSQCSLASRGGTSSSSSP